MIAVYNNSAATSQNGSLVLQVAPPSKCAIFTTSCSLLMSGKRLTLLSIPPLRTVRDSFPSYGSSLSKVSLKVKPSSNQVTFVAYFYMALFVNHNCWPFLVAISVKMRLKSCFCGNTFSTKRTAPVLSIPNFH